MKTHGSRSGFSLVELMMAMVAFSILSLAVGSMLVFGWQGWVRMNASVQMQRDASLAMRVMAREVRKCSRTSNMANITVGTNSLACANAGTNIVFSVSGGNLDMRKDGALFMTLVRGQAASLSSLKNPVNGSVQLTLNLASGGDPSQITSTIYTRN